MGWAEMEEVEAEVAVGMAAVGDTTAAVGVVGGAVQVLITGWAVAAVAACGRVVAAVCCCGDNSKTGNSLLNQT